ncbi:MAG: GNAT family N-acetyltransferase [Planctomycetota bacterium]|nr:GNAT family N-acetyltransferase [Planctomycetota bacterium]
MQKKNSSVFETTRLIGRCWNPDHAKAALEIYSDPEVTQYIPSMHSNDVEEMRQTINEIIERDRSLPQGMGSFPVFLKTTGTMIGTALIKPLPDANGELTDQVEIGWHLARRQWGRGYATEYGKKLIEIGFCEFHRDELHALVDPPNEKSKKVALRLGMERIGQTTQYYLGQLADHFVIRKS